jgi:hypothetical protein
MDNTKIKDIERKMWEHYRLYKHYEQLLKDELELVQENCVHEWQPDNSCFELDRTVFTCKKCGK